MTCTEMYMEMELLEGETLQDCRGYGYPWIYPCVDCWISDLGHAVDASTDVWYQCLISDIRINDFNICVWVGDADILLLLRMIYAFLFFLCSSYSSFPPHLRSLLLSKINDLSCRIRMGTQISLVLSQITRFRRTGSFIVTKPRCMQCICMQRGKKKNS